MYRDVQPGEVERRVCASTREASSPPRARGGGGGGVVVDALAVRRAAVGADDRAVGAAVAGGADALVELRAPRRRACAGADGVAREPGVAAVARARPLVAQPVVVARRGAVVDAVAARHPHPAGAAVSLVPSTQRPCAAQPSAAVALLRASAARHPSSHAHWPSGSGRGPSSRWGTRAPRTSAAPAPASHAHVPLSRAAVRAARRLAQPPLARRAIPAGVASALAGERVARAVRGAARRAVLDRARRVGGGVAESASPFGCAKSVPYDSTSTPTIGSVAAVVLAAAAPSAGCSAATRVRRLLARRARRGAQRLGLAARADRTAPTGRRDVSAAARRRRRDVAARTTRRRA